MVFNPYFIQYDILTSNSQIIKTLKLINFFLSIVDKLVNIIIRLEPFYLIWVSFDSLLFAYVHNMATFSDIYFTAPQNVSMDQKNKKL